MLRIFKLLLLILLASTSGFAQTEESYVLKNDHISILFEKNGDVWELKKCMRTDGTNPLTMESDEFEILLFDGSRLTANDYKIVDVEKKCDGEQQLVCFHYESKKESIAAAPKSVIVSYSLGDHSFVHKTIFLNLKEGEKIDRLQPIRFSTSVKAKHGGEGQPIYIDNWFIGMDYPVFFSRHSNNYSDPEYYYTWHYAVDMEDGNRELNPRNGLVTISHFPGYAKQNTKGDWGILSKTAVIGISPHKKEGAELAVFDYIEKTRIKPRSYLHHNNWYSREAKNLNVDIYVNQIAKTLHDKLAKYGAKLDAMVPDDGWQEKSNFEYIYQPAKKHESIVEISKALNMLDIDLGIWMGLDGSTSSVDHGVSSLGYREGTSPDFKRPRFWGGQRFFDILDPKYIADLKKSINYLLKDANVKYFKHDFNHCYSSYYLHPRHAREACLDATLDLISYERSLSPDVYINYTNGASFSPFWLQFVETIWMMSGDSPSNSDWPQLSLREGATTYRDNHFYKSFGVNIDRRPALPISSFMTHGILFSSRKPFTDYTDTLLDWANYVVMYYARGTLLKELYTSNELLDEDHWKILGTTSAWAQKNQDRLLNTVFIGGNSAKGEIYGYVSWQGDKGILTVRNPDRRSQTLTVPFNQSVYYRGDNGIPFHARAIYPYVEEMPWQLKSGESFDVAVPGGSVVVYELDRGSAKSKPCIIPEALPGFKSEVLDNSYQISLTIPDEELPNYNLLIQADARITPVCNINGIDVNTSRIQYGYNWTLASYDLRSFRGQTITLEGKFNEHKEEKKHRLMKSPKPGEKVKIEAWLVVDRKVNTIPAPQNEFIPFPLGQNYRRITQQIVKKGSEMQIK